YVARTYGSGRRIKPKQITSALPYSILSCEASLSIVVNLWQEKNFEPGDLQTLDIHESSITYCGIKK
ncbi:hypothetical protein, partial [Phosphitispora fastidiosa]|uniref:hypothetical protein n=1 Tax=Phosphitispora fastidiosa TaxID=2837202 RepID=UPI001E512E7F